MCPRSPMAEAAGLNPVQRGFDPRRGYWFPLVTRIEA